jgi:amino acid transporter
MMFTPAVTTQGIVGGTYELPGSAAIFGHNGDGLSAGQILYFCNKDGVIPATWSAIIAWILMMAAVVILLLGVILPLFKVKALTKFAGLLNLIVVIALVVAGIFMFIQVPTFLGAAGRSDASGYALGAGWIISAIVAIVAGVCAILPAAVDLASKK